MTQIWLTSSIHLKRNSRIQISSIISLNSSRLDSIHAMPRAHRHTPRGSTTKTNPKFSLKEYPIHHCECFIVHFSSCRHTATVTSLIGKTSRSHTSMMGSVQPTVQYSAGGQATVTLRQSLIIVKICPNQCKAARKMKHAWFMFRSPLLLLFIFYFMRFINGFRSTCRTIELLSSYRYLVSIHALNSAQ